MELVYVEAYRIELLTENIVQSFCCFFERGIFSFLLKERDQKPNQNICLFGIFEIGMAEFYSILLLGSVCTHVQLGSCICGGTGFCPDFVIEALFKKQQCRCSGMTAGSTLA